MWSDLREATRVKNTKSGTPPFQVKDGNQDQYGGINRASQSSSKPSTSHWANQSTTEEEPIWGSMGAPAADETHLSTPHQPFLDETGFTQGGLEQAAFKEDNLSEDQKCWLSRVRMINVTRTIDISGSRGALSYAMNTTTKGKGKLMADSCADTSIAAIGNGFAEISCSDKTVTLVGFNDDLSKKEVPIGSAATAIDLPRQTKSSSSMRHHCFKMGPTPYYLLHRPGKVV